MEHSKEQFEKIGLEFMQQEAARAEEVAKETIQGFEESWKRDNNAIGRIVKAHLMVEHHLGRYLEAAYPSITRWEELKLSFAKKVAMADGKDIPVSFMANSLRVLNKIRNRVAHRISFAVDVEERNILCRVFPVDLGEFGAIIGLPGKSLDDISLVENYAKYVCIMLNIEIEAITHRGSGMGIVGRMKWMQEEAKRMIVARDDPKEGKHQGEVGDVHE